LDNRIESGGGDFFMPNPYSWTSLGNLLYIDARQTGFSYNLVDQPSNIGVRFQEFNAQNHNPFFDAADFLRVILRFLKNHPELQSNPVVIVGESYGGIRTTTMLHLLLNYNEFGNGTHMYQDQSLVQEIQTHFNAVFPQYHSQIVPPEVITQQFGHQILVQPAITYGHQGEITDDMILQPGGLIEQFEEESGVLYDPDIHPSTLSYIMDVVGRDYYIYTKPSNWLFGFFENAGRLLHFTDDLSLITGTDATQIPDLYASARAQAYKVIETDYPYEVIPDETTPFIRYHFLEPALLQAIKSDKESGDLSLVFGNLQPWDRYFIDLNYNANWAFHVYNVAIVRGYEVTMYESRFGDMFLKNVAHVDTFITNAALDLVVYSAAIPPSLARHDHIVESVQHLKTPWQGKDRPGRIILKYLPSAFPDISNLDTRSIRFPLYDSSCHAVSLTQPEELYHDVSEWLKDKGLDSLEMGRGKNDHLKHKK
jgi:hypothetical protein